MKKLFEYAGLITLVLFSFYYTNEIVEINNSNDPIMVSINKYAEKYDTKCIEGSISSEGIILGISGFIVNPELSYSNMKGVGFSEELMVFGEQKCVVTKENNIDSYILKGNPDKNAVSILIKVKDFSYINQIINISETKKIKLGIIVNGKILEDNKTYLNVILNNDYDILYTGNDKEDFNNFIDIIKFYDRTYKPFCIYTSNNDLIDLCYKKDINSIKSNFYYTKDILTNVKTSLDKGNIIVLEENKNIVNELSILVNFIKSKGYDILNITKHLE